MSSPPEKKIQIYLMSQRKQWHHDPLPDGWEQISWNRYDLVECALFEKSESELTETDHRLIANYGTKPAGWIEANPKCPIAWKVDQQVLDRSEVGIQKYGTNLERTDIDFIGWIQHLQEELLDAAVYLERLKSEETPIYSPDQISLCDGVGSDDPEEGWRDGCETCIRRTTPRGPDSLIMKPPPIITFECEHLIEPSDSGA